MEAKLSAVIITKNEERHIQSCLESLNWVDEIVIVDDYSTDKTVDIAQKYTDKIYRRHLDNFSNQRNFAAEKASSEWILSVDADEVVSKELADEIKAILGNTANNYNGFDIPIKSYFFGKELKYGGWYPDYHIRLFKKGFARWQRSVHEMLVVKGKIARLKGHLIHYNYDNIAEFITRTNIYTSKEVEEGEVEGGIFKIIFTPLKVFINRYILKQGFRDGMHGFIVASLMAFYVFILRIKKWEKDKAKSL